MRSSTRLSSASVAVCAVDLGDEEADGDDQHEQREPKERGDLERRVGLFAELLERCLRLQAERAEKDGHEGEGCEQRKQVVGLGAVRPHERVHDKGKEREDRPKEELRPRAWGHEGEPAGEHELLDDDHHLPPRGGRRVVTHKPPERSVQPPRFRPLQRGKQAEVRQRHAECPHADDRPCGRLHAGRRRERSLGGALDLIVFSEEAAIAATYEGEAVARSQRAEAKAGDGREGQEDASESKGQRRAERPVQ